MFNLYISAIKKCLLLTGASGAVGFEAFQQLLKRREQYDIRILNMDRKAERRLFKPYQGKADFFRGDIRHAKIVGKPLQG